jgi:hypothetical protein
MPVPANPKIYHIVHIGNLASIVNDGCLWPDTVMFQRQGAEIIGNNEIKRDRLALAVSCHPQTTVGEYVPFYFCARSVMLYVISKKNHPNVAYREGQDAVIHLMADLNAAMQWADEHQHKWAFTDINAANRAADFFSERADLSALNWDAIRAHDWKNCRDHKMAEFLMHGRFPWELFEGIGVFSEPLGARVLQVIASHDHRPPVKVKRDWYY